MWPANSTFWCCRPRRDTKPSELRQMAKTEGIRQQYLPFNTCRTSSTSTVIKWCWRDLKSKSKFNESYVHVVDVNDRLLKQAQDVRRSPPECDILPQFYHRSSACHWKLIVVAGAVFLPFLQLFPLFFSLDLLVRCRFRFHCPSKFSL